MKKFLTFIAAMLCVSTQVFADKIVASTVLPSAGKPEHVYTMKNANGLTSNALTAPTQTAENYGLFAFYAVDGKENAYFIYSSKAGKWLTYEKAASYSNGINFVKMSSARGSDDYFFVNNYSGDFYEIAPYRSNGEPAEKYVNWFGGKDSNPLDGSTTLGLWQTNGAGDAGSRWSFEEVVVVVRNYTITLPEGTTIKIGDETFSNGDTYTIEGSVKKEDITVVAPEGQFAAVAVNDMTQSISVFFAPIPEQPATVPYTNAVVYPAQQEAVGAAQLTESNGVYTLSNNVLAASFVKLGEAIYFGGSKAMDLVAGSEIFTVAFGNGDNVPASAMVLQRVAVEDLVANPTAIGGAAHYNGKQLVANYTYTYKGKTLNIVWRAVLRDGSHYLRTEMELKGVDDVDMYNIIPLTYNVDTKATGSTPKKVGNTRGAVLMNDKIFAGLETPTAYNSVSGATDDDTWELKATPVNKAVANSAWTEQAIANVPMRVQEVSGSDKTYCTYTETVSLKANQKVVVTLTYKSGSHRYNIDGVDLLDGSNSIVASDYHFGYCGTAKENNTYTFKAPNDGDFSVRVFIDKREATIPAGEIKIEVYEAKAGVVVNTDIVNIQGLWSRNTTLAAGDTWKVAGVVGLIVQDGTQANENIHATQKRRSFLAYSERERAVPWRAFPCYISWYELNINRNNAAPGQEHTNMQIGPVMEILEQWKVQMYNRYGEGPASFIIDDGWDNYGTWTFHSAFPNEMKDMAAYAADLGAGVGAWLGPVGGYGTSGGYRREYWKNKGGMQLSNPAYYETFLTAAENLVKNQHVNGKGTYNFFKFDGISAQFSAVGPDDGDTGNENAEGIIRLEQYVRENLKEDIFFNTTVGTWASPFWYQISDATWRQENDHGRVGDNSLNRENWITYRDNLVHQNYVTNSPICPINTLMTHGFMLTKFGPPAGDEREYEVVRRELRCAFLCGSGMVELYNDYDLMNSINGGALWADLAECIAWQKRNADVLPDAHWVGGDPWTGSQSQVYGWASWNGKKSTLALRNGANNAQTYTFTLRQALNIPANVNGSIILRKSFGVQDALEGLTEGTAINIDDNLTVNLPANTVYAFDGLDAAETVVPVQSIALETETGEATVTVANTLVVKATLNPATATFPALVWESSDEQVATVENGLVIPVKAGEVTITAKAIDGSNVTAQITITVAPQPRDPADALPFKVTTIVDGDFAVGTQWYTMQIGNGQNMITDNGDAEFITLGSGQISLDAANLWCFTGNDEEGYKIYNKQAGATKCLATSTEMKSLSGYGGTGGSTYPVLKADLPEGWSNVWDFSASDKIADTEGFFLKIFGTDYAVNNFGNIGKLAFWAEGKDAGSTVVFTMVEASTEIKQGNGEWTASNGNGTWHSRWSSTSLDGLTFSASANNMQYSNDYVAGYSGQSGSNTYTISAPEGYVVSAYEFDFANTNGDASYSLTLNAGGASYQSSATKQHVAVEGLDDRTVMFTQSGANKGVTFTDFVVTIVRSTVKPEPYFNVFEVPTTSAIPYRIPAIACAYNGDIIAVADYRHSRADIGMANNGRIDLRARISKDNGKTWGDIFDIVQGQGANSPDFMNVGFGDPCIVADRESSKVLVLSCAGNVSFPNGTRDNHQNIARFYSEDNGATWSKPDDIAESIYSQFDVRADGPVRAMFIGSGKIVQSETLKVGTHYRLYCAALVKLGNGTNTNFVLYSDDFGGSWTVLGGVHTSPIPSGGDEPKVEELPDGSILISSRTTGGRYYNIYNFTDSEKAEGFWNTSKFSGSSNNGVTAVSNSCNGEVMLVPVTRKEDSKPMFLLFQSLPLGSGRTNVGIYYKELETLADFISTDSIAANWDGRHQSSYVGSAYSTMCWQADNTIGFLYEEETLCGSGGGGYSIIYKNYSVEQITDSLYTYNPNVDRNAIVADGIDAKATVVSENVGPYVGNYLENASVAVAESLNAYKATPSKQAYESLNAAIANAPTIQVEADKWYVLRNVARSNGTRYLKPEANRFTVGDLNMANADQLFTFVPAEGGYNLYNGNFGLYLGKLGANETQPAVHETTADAGIYTVIPSATGKSGVACQNKTGNYAGLHLAGDNVRLVPWTTTAEASLWYIMPVEAFSVTMPQEGYATMCLPFGVTLPEGVTAYVATGNVTVDGIECLSIKDVESNIPAAMPVILSAAAGEYTLSIAANDAPLADNALQGVLKATSASNAEQNVYTLNADKFVKATASSVSLTANSAYLTAESTAASLPLVVDTTTGIEGVTATDNATDALYDLNGRRVKHPASGIYVTGKGQKVFIKR